MNADGPSLGGFTGTVVDAPRQPFPTSRTHPSSVRDRLHARAAGTVARVEPATTPGRSTTSLPPRDRRRARRPARRLPVIVGACSSILNVNGPTVVAVVQLVADRTTRACSPIATACRAAADVVSVNDASAGVGEPDARVGRGAAHGDVARDTTRSHPAACNARPAAQCRCSPSPIRPPTRCRRRRSRSNETTVAPSTGGIHRHGGARGAERRTRQRGRIGHGRAGNAERARRRVGDRRDARNRSGRRRRSSPARPVRRTTCCPNRRSRTTVRCGSIAAVTDGPVASIDTSAAAKSPRLSNVRMWCTPRPDDRARRPAGNACTGDASRLYCTVAPAGAGDVRRDRLPGEPAVVRRDAGRRRQRDRAASPSSRACSRGSSTPCCCSSATLPDWSTASTANSTCGELAGAPPHHCDGAVGLRRRSQLDVLPRAVAALRS